MSLFVLGILMGLTYGVMMGASVGYQLSRMTKERRHPR